MCIFLIFTMLPARVSAEQESGVSGPETVRVGWYEDSYNITGENGERSGYGYEYQQAVASYTGWKYDYVKAGWSDLLKMVQNGEIDIMSGVSYTKERADSMLFSELPMGEERYYLYADLKNTDISASDIGTLEGKRIGLLDGSIQATQFYEWEKEHELHMQHIFVTGFEDAESRIKNGELDCVISAETPQWQDVGMSAIAVTGGSDIYFVINKDRPDLKTELDNAMRVITNNDPFYADELYSRYLSASSIPVLSSDEQEWLAKHGTVKIGCVKEDRGVSDIDYATGELTGVLCDYINFASECLDGQTIKFDVLEFESQSEQIQALKDGKIDMIFHFSRDPYTAEKNGFILSGSVMSENMAAVTGAGQFDESSENVAAVEKGDIFIKSYISYNYPKWKIIEYNSFKEAEKAVRNGEADCFIAQPSQASQYIEDRKLHNVYLTQPCSSAFAVSRENTTLVSILNKTLEAMPSSMLTGALSMYDTTAQKVTLKEFVKDNIIAVAAMLTAVFLLILLLTLALLKKSRKAEAKARDEAERSTELNKKLQESQYELQAALLNAESANSAKTTFLSNMSHDIRTPMNAIVGITNLMEHEEGISDKLHSYIHKVQLSSRHLLGLINDILDMSRIESDEVRLNEEKVSLAEQVGQIDSIIRAQTNENRQVFNIYINEIVHERLISDGVRLRQIFLNLLSNAVKYTPNGGEITFEITEVSCSIPDHAKFIFTVTDNGYGMSQDFLEHIFEPFTRAENSVTNKVQGTGLGMTITKNIVDLMGGDISVESEPGKGSRFEVSLMLPVDTDADSEVGAESVLLVSDEERLIRNVKAGISESSLKFYCVPSVEDAEIWLRSGKTDVILLGGCLTNSDLPEIVKRLRGASGEAVLIFCIDYAQENNIKDIIEENGIDGMVMRPFFLSDLALAIARTRVSSAAEKDNDTILNGMRFLCAEDNELNAEILKEILSMYGASCAICTDGIKITEAFRNVRPGDYDAILMDVQMPNMNGLEATRAIRNGENPLGKTIPIIAMTANAFSEDVQNCLKAGMDAHIAKPLDVVVLEKTLRGLSLRKQ